jgi:ribosomal protein S18 acetylase RimI-like enzyme
VGVGEDRGCSVILPDEILPLRRLRASAYVAQDGKRGDEMNSILHDLTAQALAEASEANQVAFFHLFKHISSAEIYDGPEMVWFITGVAHPIMNGIAGARLAPDELDARIASTVSRFKSSDVPFIWWTGPYSQPNDLGTHLEANGLKRFSDMPGMAVDLNAINQSVSWTPDLKIERVRDIGLLKEWSDGLAWMPAPGREAMAELTVALGFGDDAPLRHYVGFLNGQIVSRSTLLLGAGVAGIYIVGTIPEARRQGIGSAMTLVPLLEAREMGYRAGVLQSSEMGYYVYHGLGFREYCKFGLYTLPPRSG